jgi:hypothetical protein
MALFDRSNNRGWRGMDDEHLRRDFENRDAMDAGGDYRGMNRDPGNRGRQREGCGPTRGATAPGRPTPPTAPSATCAPPMPAGARAGWG